MIVSHSHRFVFVHVPKVAGTSVTDALAPFADGQALVKADNQHERASSFFDRVVPSVADYFSFAFVRNPWARFHSFHAFLFNHPRNIIPEISTTPDLRSFARAIEARAPWTLNRDSLRTQRSFLVDGSGAPLLDFVGRYERLHADFAAIRARLDLGSVALPHANPSSYPPQDMDDPAVDRFVRSWFADDVRALGYAHARDTNPQPITYQGV